MFENIVAAVPWAEVDIDNTGITPEMTPTPELKSSAVLIAMGVITVVTVVARPPTLGMWNTNGSVRFETKS